MKYIYTISCLLLWQAVFASKVDTLTISSKALGYQTKCVVVLPDSYQAGTSVEYPSVYLLHGYTGDYTNWVTRVPEIKEYADTYQLIIICPDGKNSWYINGDHSNYETYVARELPAYIDSVYRTIRKKEFRAIAGLSMGGHGALYLGMRHKNTFSAAGSMSGVMDLRPLEGGYGIKEILTDTSQTNLAKYSDIRLVSAADSAIGIIIDCGVEDFLIDDNRAMHKRLLELKVPHDYTERPGGHTWDYWRNAVEYQLLFFRKRFTAAGL